MRTKYNFEIDDDTLDKYLKKLIGKVYKILPMKEQDCPTLEQYIKLLIVEVSGCTTIIDENVSWVELIFNLESLIGLQDMKVFKSQIFKCIGIIKGLSKCLESD